MAKWAITAKTNLVLDPCCGDSNLLEKAMERLLELGSTTSSAAEKVYGIEINQTTAQFAFANLYKKFGDKTTNLTTKDFLEVDPCDLPKFNALICNPPYKRHHDMSKKYKEYVYNRILRGTGIRVPKNSSLYLHFFIHATQFLADEGRMIFLTPSQYLNNKFGAVLRDVLTEEFQLHGLVLFDEHLSIFPDAMSTACLTLLEKRQPEAGDEVMLIKTKRIVEAQVLLDALQSQLFKGISVRKIHLKKLREKKKWRALFETSCLPYCATRNLQDFATAKRGLATGANDFFVLTDEEASELGIERQFLRPVLAKAHDAPYFDFVKEDWVNLKENGKKVWLFSCDLSKEQLANTNALYHIERGEKLKYNNRYITSHQRPWYRLERRAPSKIIFTYMSKGNPRFIYNEAKIVTLNSFHCIYPNNSTCMNDKKVKALLAYLNSSTLRRILPYLGRIYSGGLLKIEPSEAQNLPVVDIDKLSRGEVADLARLFDRLRKQYRENRVWDTEEIDQTLNSIRKGALDKPLGSIGG